MILLIFASYFLGSSLSIILSRQVIQFGAINLFGGSFSKVIPSFDPRMASSKTFDLLDFVISIVLGLLIFGINYVIRKKFFTIENWSIDLGYLIFSLLIFLQIHFVTFSGKDSLVLIAVFQILYWALRRYIGYEGTFKFSALPMANGVFAGFYLMLLTRDLTTIAVFPLLLLLLVPFVYAVVLKDKLNNLAKNPLHLLFILSVFMPMKVLLLVALGVIVMTGVVLLRNRMTGVLEWAQRLYPAAVIFLIAYNPLFYVGGLDSVEEGFWLAWIQRLMGGQVLYRDVAVYHPPLLIWGSYLWERLTGFSIYSVRLFFHLLQISGFIIYYYWVKSFLSKKVNIIGVMLMTLGFSPVLVRNNLEIRLALGLLAFVVWNLFLTTGKKNWIILSGVLSALAFFTSFEVGIGVILILMVGTLLFSSKKRLLGVVYLGIGLLIGSVPILVTMVIHGALGEFINQGIFYAKSFAAGYLNLPMERAVSLSFLHWHIVNQYLSSTAWMWEIARMGIVITFTGVVIGFYTKKFDNKSKYISMIALFGIVLFRSALGRSDWYHLLFVLLISIPLIFNFLEHHLPNSRLSSWIVIGLFVVVFSRDKINADFFENQIYKLQTYGKVLSKHNYYGLERGKILVGEEINTKETDELIKYVVERTRSNDGIFVYPWMPELYFLTNRKNSTSFDTPYAFYTIEHQSQLVSQLVVNRPKLIIYNSEMKFGGMTPDSLKLVNDYILNNYKEVYRSGKNLVLEPI